MFARMFEIGREIRMGYLSTGLVKGERMPIKLQPTVIKIKFILLFFFARCVPIGTPGLRPTGPLPYPSHLNS